VSDSLRRNATLGVHRVHVPLWPHASLESFVSPVNQITNVTKEDDASVLVLTNHLYVFAQSFFVYVGSAEMSVTDWPDTECLASTKCFGDSGNAHISSL
jgi:hypothetical protein